jgi:Glu-tRNA(Gln) amidotransferase subunit E-like FAD-binding protein
MSRKLASIDQQIENLKKKKLEIQNRQIESLAKLISKCGLENIEKEVLAGALLFVANADEKEKEEWRKAGLKFLTPKHSARAQTAA